MFYRQNYGDFASLCPTRISENTPRILSLDLPQNASVAGSVPPLIRPARSSADGW